MSQSYSFSSPGIDWDDLFFSCYKKIEWKMPNLQQSMTIGVDEEFYDYLVSGTSAKGWHFTHVQMALEAIFVKRFCKEIPGKHDRIPIEEIKNELNEEFQLLQTA
jgi:hypothetical protein